MIDKKTFLAFTLIAAVMIVWSLMVPQPTPQSQNNERTSAVNNLDVADDSVADPGSYNYDDTPSPPEYTKNEPPVDTVESGSFTIDTPLYTALISNVSGGSILSFELKNYFKNDSGPVNLVLEQNKNNLVLSGISLESGPFTLDDPWAMDGVVSGSVIHLSTGSKTVRFQTTLDGLPVEKMLTFFADSYLIENTIDMTAVSNILAQNSFAYFWKGGLPSTEINEKDDATYFKGFVYQGDEVIESDIDDYDGSASHISYTGNTDWVAVRTKYFLSALIPSDPALGALTGGATVNNRARHDVALVIDAGKPQAVSLFLGPLEYKTIHGLGVELQKTMSLGFAPIRPISRGVLYLMQQLYVLIPNYGLVLIVFSILVKIAVYPLTKKSYESTRKMQEVQPLVTDLRTKHKNDPQKLNKATMELYKEYGVNPLGGCLPILLQMPLLFALFQVFRSTIELRGAPFVLWIRDLSAPDTLVEIGGFPLNILPLVMVITMLLQQRMTPAQGGPQQKMTMYVMNVFFLFLFYRFPSGLNLYYTLFNALTILQQKFLTPHKPLPVPVKSKKKK